MVRSLPLLCAGVVTVLATACGEGRIFLPVPAAQGARSMVLLAEMGSSTDVRGVDLESDLAIDLPLVATRGDAINLDAALFDRTLAELSITTGPLASAGEEGRLLSDTRNGMLAMKALHFKAGDAPPEWQETTSLGSRGTTFRLPAPASPCALFGLEVDRIETMYGAAFAIPIDEHRALVGARDNQVFEVTMDAVKPLGRLSLSAASSGIRLGPDEYWFGGSYGDLATASLNPSFSSHAVGGVRSPTTLWWLAGGSTPTGPELFTVSYDGRFERYFLGQVDELHIFDSNAGNNPVSGVGWIEPGHAIAVSPSSRSVIRWKNGTKTVEPTPSIGGFTGAAHIPGFGSVVGDANGVMFVERDGTWTQLPDDDHVPLWVMTLVPFEDGFVYGTAFGNLRQYIPSHGFCPAIHPLGFDVRFIAPVGPDIIVAGNQDGANPISIVRLRRR